MRTVREIHNFLQTLAPEYMQESWDHVGLLCGRTNAPVTRILVALDPFAAACEEARALGAQLLVTHHPAIWELPAVNDTTAQGRNLLFLIENGIAALNAHTNLDKAPGGVNDCLAAALGLTEVAVIDPEGTDAQGRTACCGAEASRRRVPRTLRALSGRRWTVLACVMPTAGGKSGLSPWAAAPARGSLRAWRSWAATPLSPPTSSTTPLPTRSRLASR